MTCKTKIVFSLPIGLHNGGVTTWTLGLARRLTALNCNAEVICHSKYCENDFQEPSDIRFVKVAGNDACAASSQDVIDFIPKYNQCVDGKTVFVPNFCWGSFASAAALALSNPNNIRIIGMCHTDQEHYYEVLSYYEPVISKFIGVSSEIINNLLMLFPHRADDIYKLVYPVPVATSPKGKELQSSSLIIAYGGRIVQEQKRIRDVEPLCQKLEKTNGKYHFIFAGDGEELPWLQQFFSTACFKNISAEFLGFVAPEMMSAVWRNADVAIMFSEYEGTSISMLEAMGQGVIPVVTRVSGVEDIVKEGINGHVVNIGDMESLAFVLYKLHADMSQLFILSENARTSTLNNNSFEKYDLVFTRIAEECFEKYNCMSWPDEKHVFPARRNMAAAEQSSFHAYSSRAMVNVLIKRLISKLTYVTQ